MLTPVLIVLNVLIISIGVYQAIKESKEGKALSRTIVFTACAIILLNGIVAILQIILPSNAEKDLATIKQEQRQQKEMLGQVLDYLDGLPQTKTPQLKRLFEKGYSLYGEEKYPEAIDTLKSCLELKTTDTEREALLFLIGNAFYTLGKLKEAEDYYQEALLIGRRINDKQGEAYALRNIGSIYRNKGDMDQALKYHQEALTFDKGISYKQGEAFDLFNLGVNYHVKGDLDLALNYYKEALKIIIEIGNRDGEASSMGAIGLIYKSKGDLDQALKYYNKAANIFEKIQMPEEALKYYLDALEINRRIGEKDGEASDLGNIGLIYEAKGDLDKALEYYNEALEIYEGMDKQEEINNTKRNIERVAQQLKNNK